MPRALVNRPGFLSDILTFDAPAVKLILDKCRMLQESPEQGGKAKARLIDRKDNLHRLKAADFRIFYTYDDQKVSLWGVRRKTVKGQYRGQKGGDVTYDGINDVEDEDFDIDEIPPEFNHNQSSWISGNRGKTDLPEPITPDLLSKLGIPQKYAKRLAKIANQEDLLGCPKVPDSHLIAIDRYMFNEPISSRAYQPELVAPNGIDDLMRYAQGELVGFLLRLSPEQEKYVRWATTSQGPTLLRGGPGTGKSTVAIYRAREMIKVLQAQGVQKPRILFTTYTKALVGYSKQLLQGLLGDDLRLVEVKTVDNIVQSILYRRGMTLSFPNASQKEQLRTFALDVDFPGSLKQQLACSRAIKKLGRRYLFEEIETVIQARDIGSFSEYEKTARPGRRVALNSEQRLAVWTVAKRYALGLEQSHMHTWEQARAAAARVAKLMPDQVAKYDAVIVDEAQDLDASALRLLVEICSEANRLFVTADIHQKIHSAGYGWQSVHESLRFVGRTGLLRSNHRSTKEVTEAARDYLAKGIAEDLHPDEQSYVHTGALPAIRSVPDPRSEVELVARFIRGATRDLRLTIGSGAVIVPDSIAGISLANALETYGIPAAFLTSQNFKLDNNVVAVLPMTSAKGLEFPVVAVAGFTRTTQWPRLDGLDDDAEIEELLKARRRMFVAMTRAMRALLVVTADGDDSMLFDGFDSALWNSAG